MRNIGQVKFKDLTELYSVVCGVASNLGLAADNDGYQIVWDTDDSENKEVFRIKPDADGACTLLRIDGKEALTVDMEPEEVQGYITGLEDIRKFTDKPTGYVMTTGINVDEDGKLIGINGQDFSLFRISTRQLFTPNK